MSNYHASCLNLNGVGLLLTGPSGSGKSDLALRLIKELDAVLIADDQILLRSVNKCLIGTCPPLIAGKLEVRGIGIVNQPSRPETEIKIVFELCTDRKAIERMPEPQKIELAGVSLPLIRLYPFDQSTVHKVALACDEIR